MLRKEEGGNTSAVVEGETGRGQGQAGGRLEGAGGREEGGVLVEGDREEDQHVSLPQDGERQKMILHLISFRLWLLSRPRYHFAGMQGEHYERAPYRNHQSCSEQSKHVTRFITLAKVENKEKKKWLYAFNISPMSSMVCGDLVSQPACRGD